MRKKAKKFNKSKAVLSRDFVRKMRLLKYPADSEGVCHGIACVGLEAMLLKKLKKFNADVNKIRCTVSENGAPLAVRTFCEVVEICQNPGDYPHFFPSGKPNRVIIPAQNPFTVMPLVMSTDLEKQGGIVCIEKFSGIYNKSKLKIYFQLIREAVEKFPHPMALLISDDDHILAVTYCTTENAWFLIDAKCLPARQYIADEAIAKAITSTLSCDLKKCVISTVVVASQQYADIAKQACHHYTTLPAWRQLHRINIGAKRYFARWLMVAALDGCGRDVQLLLANGADPNAPHSKGTQPVSVAAQQGFYRIVKLLLQYGADPNGWKNSNHSPLFLAKSRGHNNIAALLKENGARLQTHERPMLSRANIR